MIARFDFRACSALILFAAATGSCSASSQSIKAPEAAQASTLEFTGYVVDQAGAISQEQRRILTDRLGRFQRQSGHQIAVVTISSLDGQDIAVFSLALAKRWGVGRKGLNDGVVLLVAPHEGKARIEVGVGLEAQLTDAFCRDVMKQDMVPHFAKEHTGAGLQAGVTAIISRLKGAKS